MMWCISRSIIVMIRLVFSTYARKRNHRVTQQSIHNILYLQFSTVEREMFFARIGCRARRASPRLRSQPFYSLSCSSVFHHLYNLRSCVHQRFTLRSPFRKLSLHRTCVHALISNLVAIILCLSRPTQCKYTARTYLAAKLFDKEMQTRAHRYFHITHSRT